MKKIAILGFGRSGTSWVSDIVSKSQGGLILFEPLFPSVCKESFDYCYSNDSNTQELIIRQHLQKCLSGQYTNKWLLRNHVNQTLDKVSPSLISAIWRECNIIGFKEIRASFLLEKLWESGDYKTLFVVRHPAAVISSLQNRPWFWKGDFDGLEKHYSMFCERVIYNPINSDYLDLKLCRSTTSTKSPLRQQAIMWAVTHKIVFEQLRTTQTPCVFYEELFANPFKVARKMLESLDVNSFRLHPSYLFTPSMSTLKTNHDLHFDDNPFHIEGPSIFWKGTLNRNEVAEINSICTEYGADLYKKDGFPCYEKCIGINFIR